MSRAWIVVSSALYRWCTIVHYLSIHSCDNFIYVCLINTPPLFDCYPLLLHPTSICVHTQHTHHTTHHSLVGELGMKYHAVYGQYIAHVRHAVIKTIQNRNYATAQLSLRYLQNSPLSLLKILIMIVRLYHYALISRAYHLRDCPCPN